MRRRSEIVKNTEALGESFELGTWLGRRQAFGLIAGRCSAADAECLRNIRDHKLYRVRGVNWRQFCIRYAGISRAYANRLIQQLEEFGPNYFHVSQMARISAETYRRIAGAVSQEGIAYGGETIPIAPENAERILEAVTALRQQAEPAAEVKEVKKALEQRPIAPPATPRDKLELARKRFQRLLAGLSEISEGELSEEDRTALADLIADARLRLALLPCSLR